MKISLTLKTTFYPSPSLSASEREDVAKKIDKLKTWNNLRTFYERTEKWANKQESAEAPEAVFGKGTGKGVIQSIFMSSYVKCKGGFEEDSGISEGIMEILLMLPIGLPPCFFPLFCPN